MSVELVALLLAKFGPPAYDLIEKLIERWNSPEPVTAAFISELRTMGERTPRQAMIESLNRGGIALDSPQALSLLELLPH